MTSNEILDSLPAGPLAGLKVLDLTRQIAGPYATKLMADYGADVIKIEQPGVGDPSRHTPPFFKDVVGAENSLHYLYLNTNKKSVTLNLKSSEGQQIAINLAKNVDVVVENFRPGMMERFGLGWDTLREINPRVVLTSISNFGQTGPYRDVRASELVEYAMGGVMAISGRDDREPIKHGLSQAQYDAGANAAWVTAMGTFLQTSSPVGRWIDISIHETLASTLVMNAGYYTWLGGIQGRRPPEGDGTGNGLSDIMPCADGYVLLQPRQTDRWANVAELLDAPELDDPRFENHEDRTLNAEPLYAGLHKALSTKKKHDLFHEAAERHVLCGMVQDPSDLLNCPHLHARGYWTSVEHPSTGAMKYPGAPVRLPATPWSIRRPAPLLGQHTDEVLGDELGLGEHELQSLRGAGVV